MGSYKVQFTKSAEKDLRRIEKSRIPKILYAVEALETEPRPVGNRKLVGSESSYRIRVDDYRVVYGIDDVIRIVKIERVRHRKDVYK